MIKGANRDVWTGAFFLLLGIGVAATASTYRLGSAAAMGPGYFPLALGVILALLGLAILVVGMASQAKLALSRAELRGAIAVLGSVVLVGLLVRPVGLPIAIAVSALTCQLGSPTFRLLRAAVIAVAIAAAATLVFVEGLGVRAPLWPLFG